MQRKKKCAEAVMTGVGPLQSCAGPLCSRRAAGLVNVRTCHESGSPLGVWLVWTYWYATGTAVIPLRCRRLELRQTPVRSHTLQDRRITQLA